MGSSTDYISSPNIDFIRQVPCLPQQKCIFIEKVIELEIFEIIQGMPLDKTPSVDGFPAEFFTQRKN